MLKSKATVICVEVTISDCKFVFKPDATTICVLVKNDWFILKAEVTTPFHDVLVSRNEIYFVGKEIDLVTNYFFLVIN